MNARVRAGSEQHVNVLHMPLTHRKGHPTGHQSERGVMRSLFRDTSEVPVQIYGFNL